MMGTRGDGRCAAARRGVRGAAAGGMRGAAATLGGVCAAAAAACGGGRRGVHQVVLLVLVDEEEEEEEEEEEIYPNCHLLNTTDNYHLEDLATLSHLPTPLGCISLRTLNLRVNWITSTCFFAGKTWADGWLICTLTLFKGLILSCSKNKVFHVILLFWGIFSNILMLAGIEFCFWWSSGTQLVNISFE